MANEMTKTIKNIVEGPKVRVKISQGDTAENLFLKSGLNEKCCFAEFVVVLRHFNRGFAWCEVGRFLTVPISENGAR